MNKDYYKILDVESSATQSEIKKAFHKKAMQYHPDRNAWFKEESEKKMKEINEAYSTLSDSDKRRMYDYEYYESKWTGNTSEKHEKTSSDNKKQEKKEDNKNSQDKASQTKAPPKSSLKNKLFIYLNRLWKWSIGIFRRIPIIGQIFIIGMILWGFSSAYESVFPNNKPYQYKPTNTYKATQSTQPTTQVTNNTISNTNSETVKDIYSAYCNIYKIYKLYSIAPDSKFYKSRVSNNSDVASQKIIAPRLIAERSILWQDSLMSRIETASGAFKHTVSLLKESDERLFSFLKNMKYIQNFDDFESNVLSDYAVSINILKSIPSEFVKEYQNYPYKADSDRDMVLLSMPELRWETCDNNDGLDYWDYWMQDITTTSDEMWSKKIMQDANFRETPWTNGKVIHPLIKWEFVTVLDKKKVGSMEWYQVSQYNTTGWVSYLAFVDDPSKASASNCDPINGHIDNSWYCSCNDGYKWMGKVQACVLASTVSWERILTEMEINIATCWMGWYIASYNNKCECDWKEWYKMGSNWKCEKTAF